jgi:type IV secretion system protein VirB11
MANASLQTTLAPLLLFLNGKHIQEIMINRPNEIWLDNGLTVIKQSIDMPLKMLRRLVELIAAQSGQEVGEKTPLLSALLPGGHRIQIIMSPAVKICDQQNNWHDTISLSIRKQSLSHFNLQAFNAQGGFSDVVKTKQDNIEELHKLYQEGKYLELLVQAVNLKKTILVSGGTYSGKTTLLNMLINEISKNERLITIEDTPELTIAQENHVRLFYSRGMQSAAKLGAQDLLNATLRMRPDRIIMGELRDTDASCWLQAANTGHEGTLSTIHSDTPLLAIQKLSDMVKMQYPMQSDTSIKKYIYAVLDMIIQVKRDINTGRRYISEIFILN